MKSLRFLIFLFQSIHLLSFPILEKGVGPWSFAPSLTSNSLSWVVSWNQEGNIAGPIAYSFFDADSKRMSPSKVISGLFGIKPQVKINNLNRGILLVDTTKGALVSSSFRDIPPFFTNQASIDTSKNFPNNPQVYFLDSGFGFCAFEDASSQIFYTFYDANNQAFIKPENIPQVKVGSSLLCSGFEEKPMIVFSDLEKSQLFYAFFNTRSQTFTPFKVIAGSEDSCNLRLSINKKGKGILTWNTGASTSLAGKIGYSLLDAATLSFSQALFLEQETSGFNPDVNINNNGLALLCWTRLTSDGKNSLAYAVLNPDTKVFERPRLIEGSSLYPNSCKVSLNENNEAIACWFATLSGRIEYAYFDPLKKDFSSALFIKETGVNSQFPKIDFQNNKALMVWSVFGGIEYAFFDKNTQAFSKAFQILPSSTTVQDAVLNKHQQE